MGGYGSTRWNSHNPKLTTESGFALSIARVVGLIIPRQFVEGAGSYGGSIVWSVGGRETGRIGYTLQHGSAGPYLALDYSLNGQPQRYDVRLVSTHCNYGGRRWWFQCPHCGRRVGRLYLPAGEKVFACRHSHRLTYTSAKEAHKYDRAGGYVGILAQALELSWRLDALHEKTFKARGQRRKRLEAKLEALYQRSVGVTAAARQINE